MHTTWAPTAATVSHPFVHDPTRRETTVRLAMGGGPTFSPSQVLNGTWTFSPTGGSFSTNALHVPKWVMEQLARRNMTYPVPWNENDLSASWLSPGRLLLFLEASPSAVPSTGLPNVGANTALPPTTKVTAWLNGATTTVPTLQSFNCRGLHRPDCFNGFYFDLTTLTPDTNHAFRVDVVAPNLAAMDVALVFDNVEMETAGPAVLIPA
eukprot:m.205502 g.205502  ORF g.205502 m.205502 type:complete len:209 (+) comp22964_c0_seq1:75-701(+)